MICWLMPDERHPLAAAAWLRMQSDTTIAPTLSWFEIRNILLVNERRGRLDRAKMDEALLLLRRLPFLIDASVDEETLFSLARKHGLTIYDAAYLELAIRQKCDLATLDRALIAAANAEAVPLIEGATP